MPILKDHKAEMDMTYTPLEKRRREEMHLQNVRFGFFRVVTEPTKAILCSSCKKDITGICYTIVDGIPFCKSCY